VSGHKSRQFAKRCLIEAAARVGCRLSEAHAASCDTRIAFELRLSWDSPCVAVERECVGGHVQYPPIEWRVSASRLKAAETISVQQREFCSPCYSMEAAWIHWSSGVGRHGLQVTADDHVMRKEGVVRGHHGRSHGPGLSRHRRRISIIILILVDNHPRDG